MSSVKEIELLKQTRDNLLKITDDNLLNRNRSNRYLYLKLEDILIEIQGIYTLWDRTYE